MQIKLDYGAYEPIRAHATDAGLDLRAMFGGCVRAHQDMTFRTGVHVALPAGTVGLLLPKSGLMCNRSLLTFGVVDEGYTGEIKVHMFNHGCDDYNVAPGDKISQLIVVPVRYEAIEIVDELNQDSERGSNGFGSTGR